MLTYDVVLDGEIVAEGLQSNEEVKSFLASNFCDGYVYLIKYGGFVVRAYSNNKLLKVIDKTNFKQWL